MTMTKTARKRVLKDAAGHVGGFTSRDIVMLSSRHNVPAYTVRDLLVLNGYTCEHLRASQVDPPRPKPAQPVTVSRPKLPISTQEAAMIRSCKLYKTLYRGSDTVMVPTHSFRRERAAIVKLLDAFEKEH